MTIYWSFINIPREGEVCDVALGPSLPDHDFFFNLGAHEPDAPRWRLALENPVLGAEVHKLGIRVKPNEDLILIVRNAQGVEKRLRYHVADFWLDGAHVVATQTIAEYRKLFGIDN